VQNKSGIFSMFYDFCMHVYILYIKYAHISGFSRTFFFICFPNPQCIEQQGAVIQLQTRSLLTNALVLCLGA